MDANVLLNRFPEFRNYDLQLVQTIVDEQDAVTGEEWGTDRPLAITLLAAHRLAQQQLQLGAQLGQKMDTFGDGFKATMYGQQYLELLESQSFSMGFAF